MPLTYDHQNRMSYPCYGGWTITLDFLRTQNTLN